jgi:hypothetical protein
MKLDLHGIIHANVEILVEDFILKYDTPLYIITGNSKIMKDKVIQILDKHEFKWMIKLHNLGEIIVL